MMRRAALAALLVAAACGPPSRDAAVEQSARKVCKRADQCGSLEDVYASRSECISDWEATFYDAWLADRCEDINPDQLRECHDAIEGFDCDDPGIDFIGLLLTSCRANQVCED